MRDLSIRMPPSLSLSSELHEGGRQSPELRTGHWAGHLVTHQQSPFPGPWWGLGLGLFACRSCCPSSPVCCSSHPVVPTPPWGGLVLVNKLAPLGDESCRMLSPSRTGTGRCSSVCSKSTGWSPRSLVVLNASCDREWEVGIAKEGLAQMQSCHHSSAVSGSC